MHERLALALCATIVAVFTIVGFVATEAHVRAQASSGGPLSDDESSKAAAASHRGAVAAFAKGRYREAIQLWLEADRLRPNAAISFNVARSYERLAEVANALAWYRDYLYRAERPSDEDRVARRIEQLEKRLSARGVQQVTIRSSPAGARVSIDGRELGLTPWTGELTPGSHEVALDLLGYTALSQPFALQKDRALELDLLMALAPPPPAPPASAHEAEDATGLAAAATNSSTREAPGASSVPAQPPPDATVDRSAATMTKPSNGQLSKPTHTSLPTLLGAVALGTGAGALGTALVFEVLRRGAESDATSERTQIRFARDLATMHARQTLARVFAGVGAGLVVTGGVLLLLPTQPAESAEGARVSLGCAIASCEAAVAGRF